MQNLVLVGLVLLIISIILIFLGLGSNNNKNVKFAFGGFIGPLPFGFANDENMLKIVMVVVTAFMILIFLMNFVK